jgi:cytochrome P450
MTDQATAERDYFSDPSVLKDPYDYFEEMFSKGPVHQLQSRDIVMVTGYDEALEVLRNTQDFSSAICVVGAAYPLPFEPRGDDVSEQIKAHRHEIPGSDLLVTYDQPQHPASRSLLNRLFAPSRLKAMEGYMSGLADKLLQDAVARGGCELVKEIAVPYVTYVVADLLGVPATDRDLFRAALDQSAPPGNMNDSEKPTEFSALEYMAGFFVRYVHERRANPGTDVLSEFATAKYPDGSTPDAMELVRLSTFLFGAGQDTTAKLLGNSMRYIIDTPGLQQQLRANRALIPAFIEEVLRLEGSSKVTFRVARKKTRVLDTEIPAGKRVVVALAAANRDPRRWEEPKAFKLDRPKIREHLAFGRGAHTCIGAPLARAEVRIMLDRLLEHTSDIGFSEAYHGKPGNRRLDYEPSFIIRGLAQLHLELKAA